MQKRFHDLRDTSSAALIPFFACGDPDIETTVRVCAAAEAAGADIIELGVPFSDPVADGPVIQAAFARALSRGFRVSQVFKVAARLRREGLRVPLAAMVSYTLVLRRGVEKFASDAKDSGMDALIVPDLPHGASDLVRPSCDARGLHLIPLVAPTTSPERRASIARSATGFVYYVSVAGITGARDQLPEGLAENVRAIQALTEVPVCVGFGISRPEQAASVAAVADGVIVGSALCREIDELARGGASPSAIGEALGARIAALAKAAHGHGH